MKSNDIVTNNQEKMWSGVGMWCDERRPGSDAIAFGLYLIFKLPFINYENVLNPNSSVLK
jgi:hypothetical protein